MARARIEEVDVKNGCALPRCRRRPNATLSAVSPAPDRQALTVDRRVPDACLNPERPSRCQAAHGIFDTGA
ncbi:hypothetical protein [Azospirillum doebereinerae]